MTNASPVTGFPLITDQGRSARWRFRVLLAFLGGYFFIAFAAPILIDDAGLLLLRPSSWWKDMDRHWLMGCAILVAGWVALGPGRMAIRAPQGLLAIGWLLLAWLLGLTMSPNWKPELEWTGLGCAAVATATFVILLVVRRFSGRMIARADGTSAMGTRRFQYSLTTLLLVMLLVCVTLTLFGWIDPRYRNYADDPNVQSRWYVGLRRRELEWDVLKETLAAMFVAAACLPVFLSYRKRSFLWALGLSAVAIIASMLFDPIVRAHVLVPLLQGKPLLPWAIDYYLIPHVANLAAVAICLLTAAAAMHWLGYRIKREDPHPGPLPRGEGGVTPDTPRVDTARRSPGE